nr:MAG TPA: hypothetical protein [Caudoviricetes sp.]
MDCYRNIDRVEIYMEAQLLSQSPLKQFWALYRMLLIKVKR